ncbi:MAG: hypothetical protein ACLRPZ_03830 [Coprococcus sp.]
MPKIKNCTICGKEFESYNGIEVCSDECRLERKRQQDIKSNERRKNGQSNEPITYTCPICGKEFEGIAQKYCSKKCREIGRKKNVDENNRIHYEKVKEKNKIKD